MVKTETEYSIKNGKEIQIKRFSNGIPRIEKHFDTESQSDRERLEMQILNTYDIRFNIIQNLFEKRIKGEREYGKLKEEEIERALAYNSIKFKAGEIGKILNSGVVPEYNPFQYYFENLKYDGKTDYIGKLLKFIQIKEKKGEKKQSEWFENHLRKVFPRAIACAIDGKVNKQAFIFYGQKHNSGKSTLIRWFRPEALREYFTEQLNMDNPKDAEISLGSNFIINMDELQGLDKADKEHLKGMMSRDFIKIRRPYGKDDVYITRRANFFGSTNTLEFMNDITGSVRWLVFEIEKLDWDYSKKIKPDDIWAQAYHQYKQGFEFNLTEAEIDENEKRNKRHQISFSELEVLSKFCEPPDELIPGSGNYPDAELLTATDVLQFINEKTDHRLKLSTIYVGRALNMLGFPKGVDDEGKYPIKKYWVKRFL